MNLGEHNDDTLADLLDSRALFEHHSDGQRPTATTPMEGRSGLLRYGRRPGSSH